MTIHSITFAQPYWLLVGLVAAATLVGLGFRLDRQRRAALAAFGARRAGAASSLSRPRRVLKRGLVVVGMLAAFTALARPQRGYREEALQRRGVDLLFAIDTSKSMRAPDLKPNRLTRAKLAVADLVNEFQGDRVGLVAFAGDAFLQCPLTFDRDMFTQTLDAVDTSIIARGGTDVGRAIEVARAALHNEPANQKILVFLTDGEDLEAHAVDAARAAAADGVRIYTVGVGTAAGELIPLGSGADGRFVRDESGAFVRSRLDERTLRTMASVTGGDYRRLGVDGSGLEALYRDVLAKLPRESLGTRTRRVPLEKFQWPLALALACFGLEPLIRERRRGQALQREPAPHGKRLAVFARRATVAAAGLVALSAARLAHASPVDGERAYRAGHFADASKAYAHAAATAPNDSRLLYNQGAAAYKAGDLTSAKAAFDRALRSDRLDLQRNAYYDLGNTLYRDGQKSVAQAPEQTMDTWKHAIAAYESALALDKKDADATFNRDLVKRKLAALEQQQKQAQNQQQKNQQGQGQKNQQKDQKGGQSQSAQNQSGQGQQQKDQKGGQSQSAQNQSGQGQQQKDQKSGQSQSAQNQSGRGQQQKDQKSGQSQSAQNQSGQGQQQKDQKGGQSQSAQNQSGQDQKQASGQGAQSQRQNQPQPGQAQNGPSPAKPGQQPSPQPQGAGQAAQNQAASGQPSQGAAPSGAGTPNGSQAQAADEVAAPGRLSRNDAKNLLDAMRGDERLLPAVRGGDERANAQEAVNRRDW